MKLIRKLSLVSISLLSLMITNCDDKDIIQTNGVRTQITCEIVESGSRTQVDGTQTTDGSTGILWSVGDAIGVFGNSTLNAKFEANNTKPARKTTFTGELASGDTPLYAYYPYLEGIYDANDNLQSITDPTNVPVSVDFEQSYTNMSSIAPYDLKAGNNPTLEDGSYKFTFSPLVALLKFKLELEGVEGITTGEVLESIAVEPHDDNTNTSAWTGNFHLDLTTQALSEINGESTLGVKLNFDETPSVTKSIVGYAAIVPAIKANDKLRIYINTNKHEVSLTVTARTKFEAGKCYDIPLVLKNVTEENELSVVENESEDVEAPVLNSFKFELAKNEGKLLNTEVYYNGSITTTRTVSDPKTMEVITSEEGENTVTGCIPYLYDFNLTPTFEVSEGAVVYVNDVEQTSGESEQDFSSTVTYTVMWEDGSASRDYQVTVTNTGLPVVVLTQNDPDNVYSESGENQYTEVSKVYMGTTIPSKVTDFDNLESSSTIQIYENGIISLNETCGFRLRGNSSQLFPKRPMAIKLDNKQSVLGMPKHKRWCLLAGWTDRSMIRNAVAFTIANAIKDHFTNTSETDADGYGLRWNPSGKNVELVLNGVHVGNYFLCEQIKIDDNRLAINEPYDAKDNPTFANCGFLLESDDAYDEDFKFKTSSYSIPFMFKDEVTTSMQNTVYNYVNSIEQNLMNRNYSTAYNNLHINSIIDWWFVQELAMNYEYRHPKSVYTYKDGEGKLHGGPVWDFDYQTFPNVSVVNSNKDSENSGYNYYNNGNNKIKYSYSTLLHTLYSSSSEPFMWYPLLFADSDTFVPRVKARWNSLYATLSGIVATIRTLGEANKKSDEYNKAMWPMNSGERYTRRDDNSTWFIDCCGDEGLNSYDAVIENLISVYQSRLDAMNTAINNL